MLSLFFSLSVPLSLSPSPSLSLSLCRYLLVVYTPEITHFFMLSHYDNIRCYLDWWDQFSFLSFISSMPLGPTVLVTLLNNENRCLPSVCCSQYCCLFRFISFHTILPSQLWKDLYLCLRFSFFIAFFFCQLVHFFLGWNT